MLNAAVHINVREVEGAIVVRTVQDVRDVARDVEAERRRKVISCPDLSGQLAEGNIAPVSWEDAWGEGAREMRRATFA